jgi:hypothetical protein
VNFSVDLTGYFVLPASGFFKTYSDGFTQTYVNDTVVNGTPCAQVIDNAGNREYLATADRSWVGTLDTVGGGTLFLLTPPLAGLPNQMPMHPPHVGNSGFVTQTGTIPVRRTSYLVDTGLSLTVPAGTFDSVAMIRQEFWVFTTNGLGIPDTTIDSVYRWFAPGVDEIRRIRWRDGSPTSTTREYSGGVLP